MKNQQFIIEPHFRLQEWVAEEKGYFADEGLDYIFRRRSSATDGKQHDHRATRSAPSRRFENGRTADVSCACHWTVNVAASNGHGKLYADIYSVAPAGIFVPRESPIRKPEDLAGVPISVGYQSGSHYATIQALEQYMPRDKINLSFADGMLFQRLEHLIDGKVPASHPVQRSLLLRRAAGLPQGHRHHLHDRLDDHRQPEPEDVQEVLPRAASAPSATSICGPSTTRTTTGTSSRTRFHAAWTRAAGARASASCSSPTPRRSSPQSREWIAAREIFDAGKAPLATDSYDAAVLRIT